MHWNPQHVEFTLNLNAPKFPYPRYFQRNENFEPDWSMFIGVLLLRNEKLTFLICYGFSFKKWEVNVPQKNSNAIACVCRKILFSEHPNRFH